MKKILIPTDFTIESLQLIEYAILNYPDTKLDIILIAGYRLPDTYWEIRYFNKRELIRKQFTDGFKKAWRRIVFEHKNIIETFSFELFTGTNSLAFQAFLEELGAEDAIIPKNKTLHFLNRKWFNIIRFIKENVKNVIEAPVEFKEKVSPRKFSLASFFNL